MSSTILYDPTFPHGTPEGFTRGCHGSHCPAELSCADYTARFRGDFAFRKAMNNGITVTDYLTHERVMAQEAARAALAAEKAAREARAARSREEARTRRNARRREERRLNPGTTSPKRGDGIPRTPLQIAIHQLHTEGLPDLEIAKRLGKKRNQIKGVRLYLHLNPNPAGRFRVFILAWPTERTLAHTGGGRGRRRTVASGRGEGTRSDTQTHGADACDDRTPEIADMTRADVFAGEWGDWQLLPTPVAQSSGNTPEDHLRKKPGREVVTDLAIIAENGLIESGGRLMPTPRASRGGSATETMYGLGAERVDDARTQGQVTLLPTPTASEGAKGGPNQAYSSGGATLSGTVPHLLPTPGAYDGERGGSQHPDKRRAGNHSVTLQDVAEHVTNWGPYAAAIARWVAVVDRPAPAPVRFDGKGGKARLNPELTEWMMGWPAGWVTASEIGLSRAEQLKACGNGVVPQQAAAALRMLLARPGVPALEVVAA